MSPILLAKGSTKVRYPEIATSLVTSTITQIVTFHRESVSLSAADFAFFL